MRFAGAGRGNRELAVATNASIAFCFVCALPRRAKVCVFVAWLHYNERVRENAQRKGEMSYG